MPASSGIGAYAVAVGADTFRCAVLACAARVALRLQALLAFVVGRPILRLKGHYLAVATLGMGILIAMVFTNEARLTGGPDGMAVPRLVLFGWRRSRLADWYWISGADAGACGPGSPST